MIPSSFTYINTFERSLSLSHTVHALGITRPTRIEWAEKCVRAHVAFREDPAFDVHTARAGVYSPPYTDGIAELFSV
jgi:hypothetical protein